MATDWKDLLGNLRGNFSEPEKEEKVSTDTKAEDVLKQKDPVTVVTDKKGRNGKVATIIEGFTIPQIEVEALARKLKSRFGTGGSTREGEILIQGDLKKEITEILRDQNFKVR